MLQVIENHWEHTRDWQAVQGDDVALTGLVKIGKIFIFAGGYEGDGKIWNLFYVSGRPGMRRCLSNLSPLQSRRS